jgi:hypothetical protein
MLMAPIMVLSLVRTTEEVSGTHDVTIMAIFHFNRLDWWIAPPPITNSKTGMVEIRDRHFLISSRQSIRLMPFIIHRHIRLNESVEK